MRDEKATTTITPQTSASQADRLVMCLEKLRETGHICKEKGVIDIFYTVNGNNGLEERPIASVFPDDRYIRFHDEFTQIGIKVPGLKDLLHYGWNSNHT